MKFYLGVGVVLQVPDQTGAEVADIRLDFPDVVPKAVQLGDHDLVTVRAAVPVPPGDQRPCYDHDQDADGADYLGQFTEAFHLRLSFLINPDTQFVVLINLDLQGRQVDSDHYRHLDTICVFFKDFVRHRP